MAKTKTEPKEVTVQEQAWHKVEIKGLRLTIKEGITFEEWCVVSTAMLDQARNSLWLLGDALAYGDTHFHDEMWQIVDSSKYEIATIQNAMSVCRKIEPSRRREELGFSHHAAVAALPAKEQDKILQKALVDKLTVKQVRNEVKLIKPVIAREEREAVTPQDSKSEEIEVQGAINTLCEWHSIQQRKGRTWTERDKAMWLKRLEPLIKIVRSFEE